jgi:DNA repair protein RecO (recombination protein O)
MDWQDEGVLIAMRAHGEASAIIEVFTAHHGRHAGVVRGGASRKQAATMQPGTQLAVTWRARLEDHIGSFTVEPLQSRAALMGDRLGLAGLNAICAMVRVTLPEREAYPTLWRATMALLAAVEHDPDWPAIYLRWEMSLLEELGFGLDLSRCAVNGSRDDLAYVSPKTGRAVSRDGAGEWADRLLPLPHALMGQGPASGIEIAQGLAITGHFIGRELAELNGRPMPEARTRLLTLRAARNAGLPR